MPADLSDVEVSRHTKVPTEAAQLFPFQRLALDASTNLAQAVRKLAKSVVALTSCLNLLSDVGGNLHVDAVMRSRGRISPTGPKDRPGMGGRRSNGSGAVAITNKGIHTSGARHTTTHSRRHGFWRPY